MSGPRWVPALAATGACAEAGDSDRVAFRDTDCDDCGGRGYTWRIPWPARACDACGGTGTARRGEVATPIVCDDEEGAP